MGLSSFLPVVQLADIVGAAGHQQDLDPEAREQVLR
jgi:hypothetical protein